MARVTKTRVAVWAVQILLAALFLFAGGFKLALSSAALAAIAPLPPLFLKFIGACELLGGIGILLPDVLKVRQELVPLAAIGLAGVMTGAVVVTIEMQGVAPAVMPFVVGLLALVVARARRVSPRQRSAGTVNADPLPAA